MGGLGGPCAHQIQGAIVASVIDQYRLDGYGKLLAKHFELGPKEGQYFFFVIERNDNGE
jgi:hypothetical protein